MSKKKELEIELPYDLDISLLSIYPRTVSIPETYLHINIYWSTIHNSQDVVSTKISIDR